MAPSRSSKLPNGFDWVDESRKEIICLICSNRPYQTKTVKMLKGSRHGHIATKVHRDAVAEALADQQRGQLQCEQPPPPPQPPVRLQQTIASLLADESGPEDEDPMPGIEMFDGVVFDGDSMYHNGQRVVFSAGEDPKNTERERRRVLRERLEFLGITEGDMVRALNGLEEDDNVDFTTGLYAALQELDVADEEDEFDEDLDGDNSGGNRDSSDWVPYGSKTMFMLDLLDNLPRLRLSDDHMKAVIWVMRECGTPNVPTFSALRKLQRRLQDSIALTPRQHTSAIGNHFYMNHPAKLISLDWANPLVRKHIILYPEVDAAVPVSEMWQGEKWAKEIPYAELSPMWYDGSNPAKKHFYVNEITERGDGTFILPVRWVTIRGVVHAQSYLLSYSEENRAFSLADPDTVNIPAADLSRNVLDIAREASVTLRFDANVLSQAWLQGQGQPHPLRAMAHGRPLYRLRIMPWSDDVSGNISKQYNPHTNIYIQNLNLPHKLLAQEYFVRFCSTSSFASSSEQFVALVEDFERNVWHNAYDCQQSEDILFQLIPHLLPADNPQQSEHASHIGSNGLNNCRRDTTGGRDEEKETDEGYLSLFKPGTPRKPMDTIEAIKAQVRLACYGKRDDLQSNISSSGVKDRISQYWIEMLFAKSQELQQQRMKDRDTRDPRLNGRMTLPERKRVKELIQRNIQHELMNEIVRLPTFDSSLPPPTDIRSGIHYNPLLTTRGIDPHADTPVEILHTWLLGNEKYIWHDTTKMWSKTEEALFATRLESSILCGLTTPPPRAGYLVQYKNSLIGKHFKILQQLAIFHLHDLCSDAVFKLWRAAGELGAMLWIPEIDDMDEYLHDLQILIDNLLDTWACFDPGRIIVKVKLHVLTHLVDDVRRFGPPILYSTEVFECWNAIFRLCSVFSNHLSPSKDIATTLARMERFKHIVSSGWWKKQDGQWVQAGCAVRRLFSTNKEIQRRLGWADELPLERGKVKLQSRQRLNPIASDSLDLPESAALS